MSDGAEPYSNNRDASLCLKLIYVCTVYIYNMFCFCLGLIFSSHSVKEVTEGNKSADREIERGRDVSGTSQMCGGH